MFGQHDFAASFEALAEGSEFLSGSQVREYLSSHPWGRELTKEELAAAWDIADSDKKGRLNAAGWGVFVREMEVRVRRRRAREAGVRVTAETTNETPPVYDDLEPIESGEATSRLLVVLAACMRRDDGEAGAWNKGHLERCGGALGLEVDAEGLARLHFSRDRGHYLGPLLAARLRNKAALEAHMARAGVAAHVAVGAYDARARRCAARACDALGYQKDWLARVEAGVSAAMAQSRARLAEHTHRPAESNMVKYAKIGGVGLAAGAAVALTAGIAAPFVVAGLATSGAFGASTLATFASSSVMFACTFGAAGGGLASYRMRRRVLGITDFEFVDDDLPGPPPLALAIGVEGSMRDDADICAPFGVAPPAAPENLARRVRRAVAQLYGKEDDPTWCAQRATEILAAADNQERAVAKHLFGDASAKVDARPPPHRVVDEPTRALAAQALEDAVDASEPPKENDIVVLNPPDAAVLNAALALAPACDADDDDDQDAFDDCPDPTPTETQSLVARASKMFDAAFRKADDDTKNDADDEAETEAPQEESSWTRRKRWFAGVLGRKESGDDSDKDVVNGKDVPLWWWRRDFGERVGSAMHVLVWERKLLVEVTRSMQSMAASLAQSGAEKTIIVGASTSTAAIVLTTLAVPIYLIHATKYIDSTWTLGVERADAAGIALADALCARDQIGNRPVTLVGYSLGARVVFKCLETLADRHAQLSLDEATDGAVWIAPLDGVHWLPRDVERARLGLRIKTRDGGAITSSPLRLMGDRAKAPAGAPIVWLDQKSRSSLNRRHAIKVEAPDDATLEIVLVDDDSNFLTKTPDQLQVLASGSFDGWMAEARRAGTALVKLAPLAVPGAVANADDPAATIRLQLAWTADATAAAPPAHPQGGFCGIVEHAVLLGAPLKGATSNAAERQRWIKAARVVAGQFVNAYSSSDLMLAIAFRSQSWASRVAGLHKSQLPGFVRDVDVANVIQAHDDYARNIQKLLDIIDLDNPNLEP